MESINIKAVCRTAPATPGLLNIYLELDRVAPMIADPPQWNSTIGQSWTIL